MSNRRFSQTLVQKQLSKRVLRKDIELAPNFPKQNAFVEDTARFVAAKTSRRAGKSNGLALRFFKTMEKYPKSQCLYLGLTRESAFEIMWGVLQEHNDRYNLGCTFLESKLTMKHPNGSTLRLMGADMKNFIKRIRGRKYPGIAVDEAQDFGTHLQSLIDDVLTPSIADYEDGWIAMTGTPGPVPQGYFFDVTMSGKYEFSVHQWTLLDNPFMPNPGSFIEALKKKNQWDDMHPTLRREWRGEWVLDVQSLWVQYKESVNDFKHLPPANYTYILGIDIGFNDADALAVLAYNDTSKTTYLVEERIEPKQGLTELVEQVQLLDKKYQFSKMMIDAGGLGKKLAEEMRRRHQIPVQDAEKSRKQETVGFMNDALRTGRLMARKDSRFAQDSYLIQIDWERSTPDKIVIKKKPHSDIIDAVLYAFKVSPSFAYEAPVPKPAIGSQAYIDQEVSDMEQAAIDHFTALAETSDDIF